MASPITFLVESFPDELEDPHVDHLVMAMVREAGRVDMAAVLRRVRQVQPDVTSFELAQSVSRLHRLGRIRIDEELVRLRGEQIRTAVLSVP